MNDSDLVGETPPEDSAALQEALGSISMAWSALEMTLAFILAELLEVDHDTAIHTSAALDYRHRRNLINSLAGVKLAFGGSRKELESFMAQVKGMNTERNNAIHAMWGTDPKSGRTIRITMRNQGSFDVEFKPTAPGHLHSIAKKIIALANSGMALAIMIRGDTQAWRKINPPRIPPHLMSAVHRPEANPDNS